MTTTLERGNSQSERFKEERAEAWPILRAAREREGEGGVCKREREREREGEGEIRRERERERRECRHDSSGLCSPRHE